MNFLIQPIAYELNADISRKVLSIIRLRCHSDITRVADTTLFTLFHRNSIGLRSGEYGGRNTSLMFSSSAFFLTVRDL